MTNWDWEASLRTAKVIGEEICEQQVSGEQSS
jgi:hypothetical protein